MPSGDDTSEPEPEATAAQERSGRPYRLVLFAVAFLGLAVAGVWWAIARAEVSTEDLAILGDLSPATLALLLGLAIAIYVTDVWRYRALGRAVGERVSIRAGLDASVANFFFSWLTPGSAFGAPATIFMLGRHGVSWDAAALIAFGKSMGGIAILLIAAFFVLLLGIGPQFHPSVLWVALPGVAFVASMLGTMLLAALWPERSVALIERVAEALVRRGPLSGPRARRVVEAIAGTCVGAVKRLGKLRHGGIGPLLDITASQLAYFVSFTGVAVVLGLAVGASSWVMTMGVAITFVAFSYVAPTPGGSGLAEAAALPFFGGLLPPHEAVLVALSFRALTFYLQIVFGLVYLVLVGGITEIARRA